MSRMQLLVLLGAAHGGEAPAGVVAAVGLLLLAH